jgi:DNA-directed RNA polymerase specialized sigma24 family protein
MEPRVARGSENKQTVRRYIEGFTMSDHAQILSCLADDVASWARRSGC